MQGSSDIDLALDVFVDSGNFVEFSVDQRVGVVGESTKSVCSLGLDIAELVTDNVLALFSHHQLHQSLPVLLVELLKDVASTALRSHQDMLKNYI